MNAHRIEAFCDWLETLPPNTQFHRHPGFRFYAPLTPAEISAAEGEMRRRAEADFAEADALEKKSQGEKAMSAAKREVIARYASGSLFYPELHAVWTTAQQRGDRREGICPLCAPLKGGNSATRRTLAMWNSFDGSIGYNCLRCNAKGRALDREAVRSLSRDPAARAALDVRLKLSSDDAKLQWESKLQRIRHLWQRSQPAAGTIAETYLRARGYGGPIPATIRYVAADPSDHIPAPMLIGGAGHAVETEDGDLAIAPEAITGLFRIALRHDGSGKATIDRPKSSFGRLIGNPLRLRPLNDGLCLAICEGIEDALSLGGSVGVGAWAIGGAGFFESAASIIPAYVDCVVLGEDDNEAGRLGCDKVEAVINVRKDWLAGRPPSVRRVRVWEGGDA